MFEKQKVMFIYCISPVHMGSGVALGAVDNPIQREIHTKHPVMAGSGIKGALRHEAFHNQDWNGELVKKIFGPEPGEGDEESRHAGAVSFSDGQMVLFPVRSIRKSFVYITSPLVLNRVKRLLSIAGITDFSLPEGFDSLKDEECVIFNDDLLVDRKLFLEAYSFDARKVDSSIGEWLSNNAVPVGTEWKFFKDKIETDIVILSDTRFDYFVNNSTVVEPHVRIDDITGTAAEGALFYTENLPPETLMVSLVMASKERMKGEGVMTADNVICKIGHFNERMIQMGGDSTTGRGQVVLKIVGEPTVNRKE